MPWINARGVWFGLAVLVAVTALVAACTLQLGQSNLASQTAADLPPGPPPNIVILYADDLGYGDVGVYNPDSKIPTPNIDALAARGMMFTDGHSSSGICTPSRYAMLTGEYHWRRFNDIVHAMGPSVFRPEDFTIAKMFQSRGYTTAAIGKWHLGWDWNAIKNPGNHTVRMGNKNVPTPQAYDWSKPIPGGPLDQGFDHYFGDGTINFPPYAYFDGDRLIEPPTALLDRSRLRGPKEGRGEYRDGVMADNWSPYDVLPSLEQNAVEWIERQSPDQPFFLYFSFPSPHAPIIPNDEFDGTSQAGPYGDFVVQTDAVVGTIIDALNANGFGDNTLIVFTSDNGPENYAYPRTRKHGHFSAGPWRGLKRDLFEGGHRVPFIVSWPGKIPQDTVANQTVNQVDLAMTFARIIDHPVAADQAIDSHDLLPVLTRTAGTDPVRMATIHNTWAGKYAIRQGDWVYINVPDGAHNRIPNWFKKKMGYQPQTTPGLLYNLAEDPGQTRNLYDKHPRRVAQMDALLQAYRDGQPSAPHAQD